MQMSGKKRKKMFVRQVVHDEKGSDIVCVCMYVCVIVYLGRMKLPIYNTLTISETRTDYTDVGATDRVAEFVRFDAT